ncbi:hypothetical protein GCM10011396_32470 [Undibacterium terreum]|uniref:DUF4398 domain-containing protein n=2 Tax=Undibacterium terreum TaxID=1224302 RepID=A0A916UPY6_9BURK|nr:hypothetical protein GCM10011396_32470 [Undibacterium terreum]
MKKFTDAGMYEQSHKAGSTWLKVACCTGLVAMSLVGCASKEKVPATSDVAVSKQAVSNATVSGAAEYAPLEVASAQDKLNQANQALAAKDYVKARELANQAQADAQLAQSKASSAKAQAAANALQDNIRVMREELDRSASVNK